MSWRDELITSASEIEDFLLRHLMAAGIAPLDFYIARKYKTTCTVETKIENEIKRVMDFDIFFDGADDLIWKNFKVHPPFNGKKLSPLGIKCGLAIAYEFSKDVIWLYSVQGEGLDYWPTITGAVPSHTPSKLTWHIGETIKKCGDNLRPAELETLCTIQKIAKDNPYGGWRALSQTDIKVSENKYFKTIVFEQMCDTTWMIIPLGDPGTRAIIEKHAGVIPCYRPSPREHKNKFIADALGAYYKKYAPDAERALTF